MSYITLDKNNFYHNLDIITKQIKTKDKIALVLKDNAYGHGVLEMANMAREYGITRAIVQDSVEALKIEGLFEYILVLADIPKKSSVKIRYTINDIKSIDKFPKDTLVELKVDTGMHRNGINPSELKEAMFRIKEHGLILEAVFTHHRSADELSSEWFWQNDIFKKVKEDSIKLAKELGFRDLRFHSANSASLFRFNNFNEDMARVGIVAYGCMDMPQAFKLGDFRPVLSLWAKKISSRELKKGQRVGYGGTYEAQSDCIVSNYDIGYGDGFLRNCSHIYITPDSKKIVGRVSMDNSSFLADRDEILIFNDARVVSKFAGTIAYEVLTSLKSDIQRRVI